MNLLFTPNGWDDYLFWQKTDKAMTKRINRLLADATRSPFDGIGKPEPLKHDYAGLWSRRIDAEHRLVYSVGDGALQVLACRFHCGS